MKLPKVLFFIAGMSPTKEEAEMAASIGAVAFRNASLIDASASAEATDAVSAADKALIPSAYEDKPFVKSLSDTVKLYQEKQKVQNAAAVDAIKEATSPVSPTKGEGAGSEAKAAAGNKGGAWQKNA